MGTCATLSVIAAIGILSGLSACASSQPAVDKSAITVEAESATGVNFSQFRTYSWAGAAAVIKDPDREWTAPNLDIGAEITYLVNRELRARGMIEVGSSPDLLVLYGVGVDMQAMQVVEPAGEDAHRIERVPTGGVLVVLADAQSREAVWAGGAVAEVLKKADPAVAKARLDYAITQMFKELPRRVGGTEQGR